MLHCVQHDAFFKALMQQAELPYQPMIRRSGLFLVNCQLLSASVTLRQKLSF
jgi:hypothetical protein